MSCSTKRIAVLMINTPRMHKYGHLAAYINYKYCSKHNYTFIVERCPRKEDMKKDWMWNEDNQYVIVWSKPAFFKWHLAHYDFIFIIDSDAIFLDHEKKIENLIHKYMEKDKDVCILAGEDCLKEGSCYAKHALNAGVMLFANKPQTFVIIDHWISAAEKECSDWKHQHTREQMCLQILKERNYDKNIKIIPYHEINGADGKWVRHYMDTSNDERSRVFDNHFTDFFRDECHFLQTSIAPHQPVKETYQLIVANPQTPFWTILLVIVVVLTSIFSVKKLFKRSVKGNKKRNYA